MQTNKPKISILLPVYNAGAFLRPCLNSILNQTYSNWELIAIDDGSTDSSHEILKAYALQDPRVKVRRNSKNQGIAMTLNRAVDLAKGKFIARMDADDIMIKNRLALQLKHLQENPDLILVGGQCQVINTQGKLTAKKAFPLNHKEIYQLSFNRCPVQHPAIMVNRELLPKDFVWYKSAHIPAEDLELFFRLFHYGNFANLPQTVLKYRRHLTNTSLINPLLTYQKAQKVRKLAMKSYGYKPSLVSRIKNLLQLVLISLLPPTLIYPLYLFLTGNFNFNLLSKRLFFAPAFSTAK